MVTPMLTERQKAILAAVVMDYIRYAEPIGSRAISRRSDFQLSPATIRNEMSDLEEMGFLLQPHTSAGRIPSDQGYRFYVDYLMKVDEWTTDRLPDLRAVVTDNFLNMERVIQQTAQILSQFSQYTTVILKKDVGQQSLRHLQLLPLSPRTAVVILVTNTGLVENKTVEIPEDISMDELSRMINVLNEKLIGVPLQRFRTQLFSEISEVLNHNMQKYDKAMAFIETLLDEKNSQTIFVDGATNILRQPEFQDVQKVKSILEQLEQTTKLMEIIGQPNDGIQVRIGSENNDQVFNDCSIVTATYQYDGSQIGTIGVLGPKRMDYAKVMRLLEHLSSQLSDTIDHWLRR
jgi:heat-inducible transcriptional repressor